VSDDIRAIEKSFLENCTPHVPESVIVRTLPKQCGRSSESIVISLLGVDLCKNEDVRGSNTDPSTTRR
jgi:hypothetical protein